MHDKNIRDKIKSVEKNKTLGGNKVINYHELSEEELKRIAKDCLKEINMRKLTEGK